MIRRRDDLEFRGIPIFNILTTVSTNQSRPFIDQNNYRRSKVKRLPAKHRIMIESANLDAQNLKNEKQ